MIALHIDRHTFDRPEDLARSLADRVATELSLAINERNQATLAVSGGETPKLFFNYLSQIDIAWDKVTITLVDERFVAPDNLRSNERLVRQHLLKNYAERARFIGLYMRSTTAELAAFSAASRINNIPRPFDVVILGMGLDGHTASFFPGGDRLKQAIDPQSRALVVPIHARGAEEPRLTLTLPLLIEAHFIALHIEGEAKLEKFEQALELGEAAEIPIRAVLRNAATPVQLFWSPSTEKGERNPYLAAESYFEMIEVREQIGESEVQLDIEDFLPELPLGNREDNQPQ